MDEYGFIDMVLSGDYNRSCKELVDKIVVENREILYSKFNKNGLINKCPDYYKILKKLIRRHNIYRDINGYVQNVIVIKKLEKDDINQFWDIIKQHRQNGSHELYYLNISKTASDIYINSLFYRNYRLHEMTREINSIEFTFHYKYDPQNMVIGFEAYSIPIIILINCD